MLLISWFSPSARTGRVSVTDCTLIEFADYMRVQQYNDVTITYVQPISREEFNRCRTRFHHVTRIHVREAANAR